MNIFDILKHQKCDIFIQLLIFLMVSIGAQYYICSVIAAE